jgi:hypothetical protein
VPRGGERDGGVPGQDVGDRLVVGVEGVRLRAVQTEYADSRRRRVTQCQRYVEHAADSERGDLRRPVRPAGVGRGVADQDGRPVAHRREERTVLALHLEVVDLGHDRVRHGRHRRLPAAGVEGDSGIAAVQRLERELDDGVDGLVHAVRLVHLHRQLREGLGHVPSHLRIRRN